MSPVIPFTMFEHVQEQSPKCPSEEESIHFDAISSERT